MSIPWVIVILVLAAIVVGLVPMANTTRSLTLKILTAVVLVFLILWVMTVFGLIGGVLRSH